MAVYNQKARIGLIYIIIFLTLLLILLVGYLFLLAPESSPKLTAVLGGLLTGFIVGLCQLFLSWYEYRSIEKFKKMKVLDIRSDRDDRSFYQNLIHNAKTHIDIMGVTATRFLEHFADIDSYREDSKTLLTVMSNGVTVRILLPRENFLETQKQKDDAKHSLTKIASIKQNYSSKFNVKYFEHVSMHSIFIVDDECILGPVFPNISSKDTPAIHLENSSPYASKYIRYFEDEWDKAQ